MTIRTVDHSIYRKIAVLAFPTIAYNMIEMGLGLTDLFIVRSFGSAATAALGLNRQVTFLFEAIILAVAMGVVMLKSQNLAKNDAGYVEKVVAQSLLIVTFLATCLGMLGYLFSPALLAFFQASPETADFAIGYLRIYCISLAFLGLNAVSAAIFRAAQNTWLPLKIAIGMALLNIPLNYFFIHGYGNIDGLGVKGAAVGTLIVRAGGSVVFLSALAFGHHRTRLALNKLFKIDLEIIRRILQVGMPLAVAGLHRNGARIVFLSIAGLSLLGETIHAAIGLGLQIRLFAVLPALAFQVALATLVGDAIGRGKVDEAEKIGRSGMFFLGGIMVGFCGVVFLWAGPISHFFIVDAKGAELGTTVLRWFAVGQFFSALAIGVQGILSGAGDTKPIARIMFMSQWLVLVPLSYVLLVSFNMDPGGLLIAWVIAPVLTFVMLYRRFVNGYWKSPG